MQFVLFVKLKYESSTIILFIGIRYSIRDLLSDLYNYAWPANLRYASAKANDVYSASSDISSLWFLCLNNLFDGDLCKNIFYFHIFYFFLVFKHDFIRYIAFTCIAASNTESDDVTNNI